MLSGLGAEDGLDVVGHYDLLLDQHLCELHDSGPVVLEQLAGAGGDFVHYGLRLLVDELRGLLAVGLGQVVAALGVVV